MWDAYQQVAANKSAAGVDRQSIAEFHQNLKNNLFKLQGSGVKPKSPV